MAGFSPSFGPLSDHERYFFDLYGYVIRHGALDSNEVAALNSAIDTMQLPPPGPTVERQRFDGFLDWNRVFLDLIDHESIVQPLIEMCGPMVRLDHVYGLYMAPGTAGLGLHGGGTPHDPSQFYTVQDGHMFNGLLAVQWALVDQGPGLGGFRCVPGSHRANFSLPANIPDSWMVDVRLNAGDVVMFTEGLTHGTSPWVADYERRSLFYKYSPGHLAWSGQHATTLAAIADRAQLTNRQRAMLQIPHVGGHRRVTY